MPATHHDLPWTAERAIALPADGDRYEVLDGELFVTPAPSFVHQSVVGRLYAMLLAYRASEPLVLNLPALFDEALGTLGEVQNTD